MERMRIMTKYTLTEIPFLPWTNDNGLVCGTLPNGGPTFDIYDAEDKPFYDGLGGDNKTYHEIAAAMVLVVNNHKALVEALKPFVEALAERHDEEETPAIRDGADIWDHPIAMNITFGDWVRRGRPLSTGLVASTYRFSLLFSLIQRLGPQSSHNRGCRGR